MACMCVSYHVINGLYVSELYPLIDGLYVNPISELYHVIVGLYVCCVIEE